MIELPDIATDTIAIKLKAPAERLVKKGHPWVFSDSIAKQNKEGKAGDIAVIFDNEENKFLACGFFDPHSPIRIKILQAHSKAKINQEWFTSRVEEAYDKRQDLLQTATNSYRLIHGENDQLPSLIADVYNHVLVIKLYASFWFAHLKDIVPALIKTSGAKTTVLRLSRTMQQQGNHLSFTDGQILDGQLENEVVKFTEHGIQFSANVIHGHKTGYFLDHRANRKRVGQLAMNKTVLDVFSYAGGFSVHALAGGARTVTSLDISQQALDMAVENAKLNTYKGRHFTIHGDAFEELNTLISQKKKYDMVVIDPPSFAKRAVEVEKALNAYKKLTNMGAQLTERNGILVLASCSSRVSSEDFFELVEETLTKRNSKYSIIEKTHHDIDHPIGFKEGAYLKCIYLKVKR